MKRNKYLEKRFSWIFIGGIFILLFIMVLLGIYSYSFITTGHPSIVATGIVAIIFGVAQVLKTKIKTILLERMKQSDEYENLLKSLNFELIETNYHKTTQNGYYHTMENHVTPFFKSDKRISQLCIEIYCDCSSLSKKEIYEIEYHDFVVTHYSIRMFSANWFFRFNPKKISTTLRSQLALVESYKLGIISEEELKTEEYWE